MKTNFKSLTIAAAVAAATAGFTGIATAQTLSSNGLGDMAIVPYYTVQGDFVTGVHIINTSDQTQVVKLRMRRATDSMDALDFNLIMSPEDEWTGFITGEEDGDITFNTGDTTCTAPERAGTFTMPGIYRNGADTGYIEVIGMGAADPNQPIAVGALHSAGVPADCTAVASNFFENQSNPSKAGFTGMGPDLTKRGVISSLTTHQTAETGVVPNAYTDTLNVLKVSYFIRDGAAGVEFGNSAVHFNDFMADASITNQESGVFSGDLQGFDFPDLNGGAPYSFLALGGQGAERGKFEGLRTAIGGTAIINDWSANQNESGFTVGTDWVITAPGQYTMLDLGAYLASLVDTDVDCDAGDGVTSPDSCDNRDIPLTATFTVYDREEAGIVQEEGDLVVSPSLPGAIPRTLLDQEVNVVEWGVAPVLDAPKVISVGTPGDSVNGWANLAVIGDTTKTQSVCDFTLDPNAPVLCTLVADETAIPLVGFVAWERSFSANPDANYGRIIEHSYATPGS